MSSSSLVLTYEYSGDPDDDFGWLGVKVVTDRSAGRGGFWVRWQDVKEFGEELNAYPIAPDAPIKSEWGYEPWEGDALVVSIKIAAADKRGNLSVKVWLRVGEGEPIECLRTSFLTQYPQLEAFRLDIAKLMDGKAEEAKLLGS